MMALLSAPYGRVHHSIIGGIMKNLCGEINRHKGAVGKELMAYVFFTYAMFASLKGNKEAEKYCSDRANECWEAHRQEEKKKGW